MAKIQAPPLFMKALRDFSQGINNKDAPNLIPDNALVDAQNAIIGLGFIQKRYGFTRYTPTALTNPINKIYDFFKSDGTKEFLATSGTTLYKDSSGTLNAVTGTLTTSSVQCLTYKDRSIHDVVLLADGGSLKAYDSTSVSTVTPHVPTASNPNASPPVVGEDQNPGSNDLVNLTNFRCLEIKKDRIFAAAHPTVKNRLSFCHHDPTLGYAVYDYWPAPFFFDIASDQNEEIQQLKVFRDKLVILCKRSIWLLDGDGTTISDYNLTQINVPFGCIAPNSVEIVGNFLFYLAEDHVYGMYNTDYGMVSAQMMSRNIENTLKSISLTDKAKAVGKFYDNKYFLSFPDGTTLIYDTIYQCWTKWTNIKANTFLNRDGVFYFAGSSGLIYHFDPTVFNDDGTAISFSMTTKNMDFELPVQDKVIRKTWAINQQYETQNSNFNISAYVDYVQINLADISTDQSAVWDEGDWDNSNWDFVDVVTTRLRGIRAKGKNIQLIITNNNIDEPFTLYGMVFQYAVKPPR